MLSVSDDRWSRHIPWQSLLARSRPIIGHGIVPGITRLPGSRPGTRGRWRLLHGAGALPTYEATHRPPSTVRWRGDHPSNPTRRQVTSNVAGIWLRQPLVFEFQSRGTRSDLWAGERRPEPMARDATTGRFRRRRCPARARWGWCPRRGEALAPASRLRLTGPFLRRVGWWTAHAGRSCLRWSGPGACPLAARTGALANPDRSSPRHSNEMSRG